jgi:hypothetical protein
MSKIDISGYIVPWSLPNEKMPMHVTWSSDVFFDKIQVKVPPDVVINDVLNVDEVSLKEHEATITKVKIPFEGVPHYFGMVVSAPIIYPELKVARKIEVKFIRGEEVFYCLELYGRIFRPSLEILDYPKEIDITDSGGSNRLPLSVKYTGFGDIELKIQADIEGKIVSVGESIVYELLRRLWQSDIVKKKRREESSDLKSKKHQVHLEPSYVQQMAQILQEKIDQGIFPIEEIDSGAIRDLKEWLTDVRTKDRFMEILYQKTQELLLDLIVDLFEKNPTDNVRLANTKTVIRTKIKTPVTTVTLKLLYRDNVGNEYPPIEKQIQVRDKRSETGPFIIEIPIHIEKWEDEPFLNVEKMKISEVQNIEHKQKGA